MQIQAKNPRYNSFGTIDLEINHPAYGWIPFTASPNDVEKLGKDIYSEAISGKFGEISSYIAPDKKPFTQNQIDEFRKSAYQEEADPVFFKWQRGEATQQDWLDKIAEIRLRYPDVDGL